MRTILDTCTETGNTIEYESDQCALIERFTTKPTYDLRYQCPLCECIEIKDINQQRKLDILINVGVAIEFINAPAIDNVPIREVLTIDEAIASCRHISELDESQVVAELTTDH